MVAYLFQFADKIIWALISLLWSGYEDPSPYLAMVSFGYFTSIASLGSNITLPTRILKTNEESVARTGTIKYLNLINYLHIIFSFIILISSLLILKIEFLISFLISLVLLLRSISSILESISVGLARYELSCIKRIYILPITFLAVIFAFINLKSEFILTILFIYFLFSSILIFSSFNNAGKELINSLFTNSYNNKIFKYSKIINNFKNFKLNYKKNLIFEIQGLIAPISMFCLVGIPILIISKSFGSRDATIFSLTFQYIFLFMIFPTTRLLKYFPTISSVLNNNLNYQNSIIVRIKYLLKFILQTIIYGVVPPIAIFFLLKITNFKNIYNLIPFQIEIFKQNIHLIIIGLISIIIVSVCATFQRSYGKDFSGISTLISSLISIIIFLNLSNNFSNPQAFISISIISYTLISVIPAILITLLINSKNDFKLI